MQAISNYKLGAEFEEEIANYLSKRFHFVYRVPNTIQGQPADIFVIDPRVNYLVECKVVTNNKFDLSRIRENQYIAMGQFQIDNCLSEFYIKYLKEDKIIVIPFKNMLNWSLNNKTLSLEDALQIGTDFTKVIKNAR